MDENIWRGDRTEPRRLADQIAEAPTEVLRLPYCEPLEIVNISCSAENRDLIVEALRSFRSH